MKHYFHKFVVLFLLISFSGLAFYFCSHESFADSGTKVSIPPLLEHIPVPQYEQQSQSLSQDIVSIITAQGEDYKFNVEVAKTANQKRIGMMFRHNVPPKTGMLFLFDQEVERSFWMKNTLVFLDLLFIRKDGVIAHIHHNATPRSLKPIPSEGPAFAVLEIGGGESKRLGITVGDRVVHNEMFGK